MSGRRSCATGATSTSICRRRTRAASAIPVVYLQDGQNLSDPATAFAGTWDLDATIDRLAWRGIDAIYVGVHNAGRNRLAEYSPFPDPRHGGGDADAYLAFLVETLKPRIDRLFSTRPRSRLDRDPRIVDGRARQPLRVLPLPVGVRRAPA